MKKTILNETPVRTAVNFNINNISLDNIDIPNNPPKFQNIEIKYDESKVRVTDSIERQDIEYGISDELTDKTFSNANSNINIEIKENIEENIRINFKFDNANKVLVDNMKIISDKNTSSTVVLKYDSDNKDSYFHNQVLKRSFP